MPDRPKSPALSSGAHRAHYVIPYRIGGINRMVFEFTMLNRGKVSLRRRWTIFMVGRDVKPDQRVDQFIRLREVIEQPAASRKFFEQAQADRPVVLRSSISTR